METPFDCEPADCRVIAEHEQQYRRPFQVRRMGRTSALGERETDRDSSICGLVPRFVFDSRCMCGVEVCMS